jgi:hypothetical protein
LEAKVAFYLKESLGASTALLARFIQALSDNLKKEKLSGFRYVWIRSRPAIGGEPIEVRIPLRSLAKELERQLPRAAVKDLPRVRKRPGWKREFAGNLEAASRDLFGVTDSEIAKAVRGYRAAKKRSPEITVGGSKR